MYSPQIKPDKVRALYQLKLKTKKTMTKLVDEAIEGFLKQKNQEVESHGTAGTE